jgi:hypothetical protein
MFIKVDHQAIPIPGTNLIYCINILFQIHWIFNINYSPQLSNLMYFFEILFKINKEFKPSINEIYNILMC